MKITNAHVFIDGRFQDVEVRFDNEKILEIGQNLKDDEVIDAQGQYLYAGIIDPHIHGGFLRSFTASAGRHFSVQEYGDPEEQIRYICNEVTKQGVTSIMPTYGDYTVEQYQEIIRLIRKVRKDVQGADPFKIHLEGCYQNPEHSSSFKHYNDVTPDKDHTLAICDYDMSDISIIGLAPELPGSMEWLDWVATQPGVHVEAGYTKAPAQVITEAAKHGLNQTTHMFNGFEKMHHRIDGPDVGVLMEDSIKCQLTLDGYHVSPYWCKLLIKVKGLENIYGLTDLCLYSGIPEGVHHFPNGVTIIAEDGLIKDEKGTIQSGNHNMSQIMYLAKNKVGLTAEEVGSIYTENVARCLDISDRGKIEVGRRPDFAIMDEDYNCLKTIIKGQVYYDCEV